MASTPSFVATPIMAVKQVSAANANRDGTGTTVDLITGSTNGTLISAIYIHATVTTTAGMVRLYVYDGTNTRLWKEVAVVAITVAAGTAGFDAVVVPEVPFILPNAYVLRGSTHNAEAINITVTGGNL